MITLEEYLEKHHVVPYLVHNNDGLPYAPLELIILDFAKLHVQEALKCAAECARAKENPSDYGTGEIWVDKKSILESYSMNNIK